MTRVAAKRLWQLLDSQALPGRVAGPRNPLLAVWKPRPVRDGQLDQAVLSTDRGFQIVAILRMPDPDLAAVQAAGFLARFAHIVERHVAQVRNECR